MTMLKVFTRFWANEIWVRPDALGRRYETLFHGYNVALIFPKVPNDFVASDEPETVDFPSVTQIGNLISDTGPAYGIIFAGVEVSFEDQISTQDKEEMPRQEFADEAQRIWEPAAEAAAKFMHAVLAWLRVETRQGWLGLSIDPPQQYGRSHLIDVETGERLISMGERESLTIKSGLLATDDNTVMRAVTRIGREEEVPVAEGLLADAQFLGMESDIQDSSRAVLSVAIACEIKTKRVIRQKMDPSVEKIADLLLSRQSSLGPLLDQILDAVLGLSLRAKDKDLFQKVQALVTLRNEIVHEGRLATENEARQGVLAARSLFRWLDQL